MSDTNMPDFQSREEEAEYLDRHFLELWQAGEPVNIKRTYSRPMQVRLDPVADRDLEMLAAEVHLKKSTLARQWLMERIEQEKARRRAS